MQQDLNFDEVINFYKNENTQHMLKQFLAPIHAFFHENPKLTDGDFPIMHSLKCRLKNPEHLKDKLIRKANKDNIIVTKDDLFQHVTDLIGVRVLYLHQEQFRDIHNEILKKLLKSKFKLINPVITQEMDAISKRQNLFS